MADQRSSYRMLAIYSGIVVLLPATLIGGFYLGTEVDAYYEIEPWGMVFGLVLGAAAGFWELFRLLRLKLKD